jgi:hypothetical protein
VIYPERELREELLGAVIKNAYNWSLDLWKSRKAMVANCTVNLLHILRINAGPMGCKNGEPIPSTAHLFMSLIPSPLFAVLGKLVLPPCSCRRSCFSLPGLACSSTLFLTIWYICQKNYTLKIYLNHSFYGMYVISYWQKWCLFFLKLCLCQREYYILSKYILQLKWSHNVF